MQLERWPGAGLRGSLGHLDFPCHFRVSLSPQSLSVPPAVTSYTAARSTYD